MKLMLLLICIGAISVAVPLASAQDIVCINSGTTCVYTGTDSTDVCVGDHSPPELCRSNFVYLDGTHVCIPKIGGLIFDRCYWVEAGPSGACFHAQGIGDSFSAIYCVGTDGVCVQTLGPPPTYFCYVAIGQGGHALCLEYRSPADYLACVG
jgi:hypothetical protein